jgi:hypothetical protein
MRTHRVSAEQYSAVNRKVAQLKRLLRQPGGSPLDPDVVLRKLELITERPPPSAPSGSTTPRQAAAIMGSAFHGVDSLKRHLDAWLYPREVTRLQMVPFSQQALEACAATHVLVAGARLSIMDMRERAPQAFYFKRAWYAEEEFANKPTKTSWYLIRKEAVPGSTSKLWDEQQESLPEDEVAPTLCEVVLAVLLHYLETGERMFSSHYVRTNDVDSGGRRVSVGRFASNGVRVQSKGDSRDYYIGVAGSKRSSWSVRSARRAPVHGRAAQPRSAAG